MTALTAACLVLGASTTAAQTGPEVRGSRNITVAGHLALEGGSGAVEVEQDASRPYVYLSRRTGPGGFAVLSLETPEAPRRLFTWDIDAPTAAPGAASRDLVYVKLENRYYLIQAFQFDAASPQADLGAVVFDVTGLPDASSIQERARLSVPGGLHSLFGYKHSDGRALLFATGGAAVHVYDFARLLAGEADHGLVARIDTPEQLQAGAAGYHDVFVGFEPVTAQDRFYGAGAGGYYVFDITDLAAPALLVTINSAAVRRGHGIAPTPDGRYVATTAGYRTAPLRLFDLQPGLDGTIPRIRTAVGAWAADWRNAAEQVELRWPYVFVAALDDGLQVFNMRDPVNPYTVGYYRTYEGPVGALADPSSNHHGAGAIDVRNRDGLIVVSDRTTGFWAFYLEAFEGWDGRGWGLPNMSSAQDWDTGPDGK